MSASCPRSNMAPPRNVDGSEPKYGQRVVCPECGRTVPLTMGGNIWPHVLPKVKA